MGLSQFGDLARSMVAGVALRAVPAPSGAPHRTGAPVLRGSVEAGTFEEIFFRSMSRDEIKTAYTVIDAATRHAKVLKRMARAGERILTRYETRMTGLNANVKEVYREILSLARKFNGKVFPSYEGLMHATKLSRSTIRRALNVLEGVGLLVRQRRFKRREVTGAGPRWEQTSNVYRVELPKALLGLLDRRLQPAPIPMDEVQRRSDQQEEHQLMMSQLSASEYAKMMVGGQLGQVLASLGACVDRLGVGVDRAEREVLLSPQPLGNIFDKGKTELAYDGQHKFEAKWGDRRRRH